MNPLLRLVTALVAFLAPPLVVLADRSPVGWATALLALAALAMFFLLYAGPGALAWFACGLVAFWRVLASGRSAAPRRAMA